MADIPKVGWDYLIRRRGSESAHKRLPGTTFFY